MKKKVSLLWEKIKKIKIIMMDQIEIEGKIFKLPNENVGEDFSTGKLFYKTKYGVTIFTDITKTRYFTKPRKKFTLNDVDTYNLYNTVNSLVDQREILGNLQTVKVILNGLPQRGEIYQIFVRDVEKFINEHELIQGINNPEIYYHKREIELMDKPKPYRKFDNTYYKQSVDDLLASPFDNKENSKEQIKELSKNILERNIVMGVDSLTHLVLENKRYTFGVELETCRGRLESDDVKNLNVKAVHDGSLREEDGSTPGGEYVTGILYGDSGFTQLHELCRTLTNKCEINNKCGVHVHIGSIKWNREDVVYSYILAELIENDLFSMLPKSRRENSYCRKLTPLTLDRLNYLRNAPNATEYNMKINEIYNMIHAEVAGSKDLDGPDANINKNRQHPKGAKCNYDKTAQRYCLLNYVTLMFDTKGIPNSHTLEFRPMSATLNYTKVKNWIKICVAFVYFVENFKSIIKAGKYTHDGKDYDLDVELIIAKSYPKTGGKLIDYVRERKEIFKTKGESVDYVDVKLERKTIKEVICV